MPNQPLRSFASVCSWRTEPQMPYFVAGLAAEVGWQDDDESNLRFDWHFFFAAGAPSSEFGDSSLLAAESSLSLRSRWIGFCCAVVTVATAAEPKPDGSARHVKLFTGLAAHVTGKAVYSIFQHLHRIDKQEVQLPQRNSASAAHVEGAKSYSPLPLPPLATNMRTVESKTRNKRMSSVPSEKRTLSCTGHSRSFKVILICADRNSERCIVVMSN